MGAMGICWVYHQENDLTRASDLNVDAATENVVAAQRIRFYSARSPHQVRGKGYAACAVFFAAQITFLGGF